MKIDWPTLRALPADVILTALGVERQGESLFCPRCSSRFQVCDDPLFGVSVRCTADRCLLGSWAWPEHALADLRRCDLEEASRCLLAARDEIAQHARRPTPDRTNAVNEARAAVAAFLAS